MSDQEYSTFLNLIQTYDVCQVLETEATVAVGQSESVPGSTLNLNFFYDLDEVPVGKFAICILEVHFLT